MRPTKTKTLKKTHSDILEGQAAPILAEYAQGKNEGESKKMQLFIVVELQNILGEQCRFTGVRFNDA